MKHQFEVFATLLLLASPAMAQGVINPMTYGAVCDGSTDDASAFQSALHALNTSAGSALVIPASEHGCKIASLLTYSIPDYGPLNIFGYGSTSKLLITSTSGGLAITGTCGASTNVYLRDFHVYTAIWPDSPFGIKLDGVSTFALDNILTAGHNIGIYGLGLQQGSIIGGSSQNDTGIKLDDCSGPGSAYASSNGVLIQGISFYDNDANINIEGGASETSITSNHMIVLSGTAPKNIIVNQTLGTGGRGATFLRNLHIENYGTGASGNLDLQYGWVVANDSTFGSNTESLVVSANGRLDVFNSLVGGTTEIADGAFIGMSNNVMLGALDNSTAAENSWFFRNRGAGAPEDSSPAAPAPAMTLTLPTLQVPKSAKSPCTVGQTTANATYVYVCTAPNAWKRVKVSTW